MATEKNNKKVTMDQMEAALNRVKESAVSGGPVVDDTATDEEFQEMLDRVFGAEEPEGGE